MLEVLHVGNSVNGGGGIASVIGSHVGRESIHCFAVTSYDQQRRFFLTKNLPALAAAARIVSTPRSVIIHLHLSNRGSLLREGALAWLSKLSGHKVVLTLHGSGMRDANRIETFMLLAVGRAANVIHLLSPVYRGIVDARREVVIPNDVPIVGAAPRSKRGPAVLFVGEIGMRKGVDRLIAMSSLNGETYSVEAIGPLDAKRRGNLLELLRENRQVRLRGSMSTVAARQAIANASLLINPSRAEAFPMVVCEALAAGTPVVGTDVGGQGELLRSSGQLVSEADPGSLDAAVLEVLGDDRVWDRLSEDGFRYAREQLSSEVVGTSWNVLYRDVMAGGRVADG